MADTSGLAEMLTTVETHLGVVQRSLSAAVDKIEQQAAALTAAEGRIKMLSEALAGVMPLTSYGPEGKSPPDELAAIAAGYAALGFCPDCGAGPKDKCRYNAMGQSCREVLRYRPRQALTGASDED